MSDFLEPIGNEEAILQNILGANNELLPPMSRNEKILLDIMGEDYPIDPPMSRIEALLIALKEKIEHDTPSGKINITENGNDIDIAQYATADVNVSGVADLGTKSITANGTYAASADNLDGYDEVTVDVSSEAPTKGLVFSDYDADGYPTKAKFYGSWTDIPYAYAGCPIPQATTNFIAKKIQQLELPSGIQTLGPFCLSKWGIKALDVPATVISFGMGNAASVCYCADLEELIFEGSTTQIGIMYSGCSGLKRMIFKAECNNIAESGGQTKIELWDFSHCTQIPVLANVYYLRCANGCVIRVPAAMLTSWQNETNWCDISTVWNVVWEGV